MNIFKYLSVVFLFFLQPAHSTNLANFLDNDDVYALSLTPSSKLKTAITENLDGTYDYQWDKFTVCYSPALGGQPELEMLEENLEWFTKVKRVPFFDEKLYAKNIEQIAKTLEKINAEKKDGSLPEQSSLPAHRNRKVLGWISYNQMLLERIFQIQDNFTAQTKGENLTLNNKGYRQLGVEFEQSHFSFPKYSDFGLEGVRGLFGRIGSKKCDRLLFTGNELVFLVLNEMKRGTDGFATKYRTYGSEHLLYGFKNYVSADSSYLNKHDVYYNNFDALLSDANVIWQSSDIYKAQKVSPLSLEKVLVAETAYSYFDELSQDIDKKNSELAEVYESGNGYFLGKRDTYGVDYEFCSIKYMKNEETGFAVASQFFSEQPKSSYIARDLKSLFNHVIKGTKNCGIILAKNSDLKLLEQPFERKNIGLELLPVYKTFKEYEIADKKITEEKLQRKLWEQELATQQRQVMCGRILKSLKAQCAESGENCLRWQYVKDSCN